MPHEGQRIPISPQVMGYAVYGAQRNGDGSFECDVVVLNPSPILGQIPEVVGTAHIRVNNDKVCEGLASAIRSIADQIPPDIRSMGLKS